MSDFSSLLKLELTGTYEGVDPAMFAHYFSHVSGEPRSRYVGTQTDENGVEQEVWEHTFTAPSSVATSFSWSTIPYASAYKRKNRIMKLRKRQRRTAQRRHNQGMRGKKR